MIRVVIRAVRIVRWLPPLRREIGISISQIEIGVEIDEREHLGGGAPFR